MDIEVTARKVAGALTVGGTRPTRLFVWSDGSISEEPAETGNRFVVARFTTGRAMTQEEIIRELINGLSRHVELEQT